jgi:hypothetical protein
MNQLALKVLPFLSLAMAVGLTIGKSVPLCDYNECDKNNPIFWGKLYANPSNFYTFYECTPDGLQIFECPDGLIFPWCGERCEWDNENSTIVPSTTTTTTTTTVEPKPSTIEPEPSTIEPEPSTIEPEPSTIESESSTIEPEPSTIEPEPSTIEPEPSTIEPNCYASIFSNAGLKSWIEASTFCRDQGLNLVNVESQEKYDCLLQLIKISGLPDATNYWTGGNDIAREGNFTWLSNGKPVDTFYPLGNGQPDNGGPGGNEDCVSLRKIFGSDANPMHVMNDEICDLKFYFICDYFW